MLTIESHVIFTFTSLLWYVWTIRVCVVLLYDLHFWQLLTFIISPKRLPSLIYVGIKTQTHVLHLYSIWKYFYYRDNEYFHLAYHKNANKNMSHHKNHNNIIVFLKNKKHMRSPKARFNSDQFNNYSKVYNNTQYYTRNLGHSMCQSVKYMLEESCNSPPAHLMRENSVWHEVIGTTHHSESYTTLTIQPIKDERHWLQIATLWSF